MYNRRLYPPRINSTKLFFDRQAWGDVDAILQNRLQSAPQYIERLELEAVLEGHNGCVNCLEWSSDGRLLASGSDDFHVMLWDPFRKKRTYNLTTPHTGNMFSVKFLPKSGNSLIATGAADKCIFVFDIHRNNEPIWNCDCHWTRVKRLATAPDMPFTFWSAGEDGNILQFDIREQHRCRSIDQVVLLNLSNHLGENGEAKCVAVNPRRSELIAVGANDAYARLYDRRMIRLKKVEQKLPRLPESERGDDLPSNCVTYFCPGQCTKNNCRSTGHDTKAITYLTFNSDGNELLVNMGAEHIYLYDINNAAEPVFLDLPEYKRSSDENIAETPKRKLPENVEAYKKMGNDFLENEKYLRAIEQYSEAIQMAPDCPILYLNRATALMRRLWYGDVYAALRDCHIALKLDPSYIKAHFRLARALLDLGRKNEADECLKEFVVRFPNYANNHGVMMLRKDITLTPERKTDPANSEMAISEVESEWRAHAKDYKERFVGHCNTTTDIKEANYFGSSGQYIVAGSDDGNIFIWERPTNKIKSIYKGDMAIVNCVQPHPSICLLATSGIDHEIKIWSPLAEITEEKTNRVLFIDASVDSNQHKMKSDPFDLNSTSTFCRSS